MSLTSQSFKDLVNILQKNYNDKKLNNINPPSFISSKIPNNNSNLQNTKTFAFNKNPFAEELNKELKTKLPNTQKKEKEQKTENISEKLEEGKNNKIKPEIKFETFDNYVNIENENNILLDENSFKILKYDSDNIQKGKNHFKNRYINKKSNAINKNNEDKNIKFSNKNYNIEKNKRKYKREYLLLMEKSIFNFNLKQYKDCYDLLIDSEIITNIEEFGIFLLVVSGFDKVLLGEFLAKEKPPNEKKEVLNSFIGSIKMNYPETNLLDCLRFLLMRIILPKDANLILVLMEKFSLNFFEINKNNAKFLEIFKNTDNIYLLISTILALNTMFTRKDIKNMNIIKKEEFKSMNKDIDEKYVDDIYEQLKKTPISLDNDYNALLYKKLSKLVQEKMKGISEIIEDDDIENNYIEKNNNDENNNEENSNLKDDNHQIEVNKNYCSRKSFSLKSNLLSFSDNDKELLSKPIKFYKIIGASEPSSMEFIVINDFKQLAYGKSIDITKQKYKNIININEINKIYTGTNHSKYIKKYIDAYPQEGIQFDNFISIIYNNQKDQLDIKSDDINLALLWFKALYSLLILTKTTKKKSTENENFEKENKLFKNIELIWDRFIMTNLKIYLNYIVIKSNEYFILSGNKITNFLNIFSKGKLDLMDEKRSLTLSYLESYAKDIYEKLSKNKETLEYNEFIGFYYLGIPIKYRPRLWDLTIGNTLGITFDLFDFYKNEIPEIDFEQLDKNYQDNPKTFFDNDYKINKIIIETIKCKNYFIQEINIQNINQKKIMTRVYNIARIFYLVRPEIPYNKGIISIIYLFLLIDQDEKTSFINIMNLICNKNIFRYFIEDKYFIDKDIKFFSGLLEKYEKKVYDHLNKLEINVELYLIPWMEELFTKCLDYKTVLRIFDLYLLNGEYILFQTAMTIIKILEEELMSLTISEVFKTFKKLPSEYNSLLFFEKFKNLNYIKDEYSNRINKEQKQCN